MAQPPFVPAVRNLHPSYVSPPHERGPWMATRPGEVVGRPDARVDSLGNQGPDQGYLLRLVDLVRDEIVVGPGEHLDDVIAGCVAVALKRASSFGRGPVVHDLRAALCVWGYLDGDAPEELVAARRAMFAEVADPHHYRERRAIADAVHDEILHRPYAAIVEMCATDWRAALDLDALAHG